MSPSPCPLLCCLRVLHRSQRVAEPFIRPWCCSFLHRLTTMTTRWFTSYGFSIGIEDVTPSFNFGHVIDAGYTECDSFMQKYKKGDLERLPGCNEEQTLESYMNGTLGRVREQVGALCKVKLPLNNAPLIMEACGSKGSALNICQMMACVGQQAVRVLSCVCTAAKRVPHPVPPLVVLLPVVVLR